MAPLISLNTNLKSLRYGKDRVGGGASGQPYIQTRISDTAPSIPTAGIFGGGTGGVDFLLRGGTLAPFRAIQDVSRLTKMFFDSRSPNGVLFTAKQNVLSRIGVKTQASGILNEGIYTPASTLLQAAGNFLGIHVNKQGLNPLRSTSPDDGAGSLFGLRDPLGLPVYTQTVKTTQSPGENRLVELKNSKFPSIAPPTAPATDLFNLTAVGSNGGRRVSLSNLISRLTSKNSISQDPNEILKYGGGPGSVLGVGKTIIRRYSNTNEGLDFVKNPTFIGRYFVLNSAQIDQIPISKNNTNVSDFRKTILDSNPSLLNPVSTGFGGLSKKNILSTSLDYSNYNNRIEGRVKLGDPGKRNKNVSDYVVGLRGPDGQLLGALDGITAYPLYKSETPTDSDETNDLCQFRIGIIDNINPTEKVYIHFRAFLDSMDDQYNAEWNPFKYMGRGENFYRYGGFTRTINLAWTVAAQSKQELIPMYQKLNFLASSLAPDYSDNGYMRGNLATLTVGGYLYEQPGIITSINYTVPQESPWEIGIGNGGTNDVDGLDPNVKELPHIIKVTGFQFIPIHNFVPNKQKNNYSEDGKIESFGDQRYISLRRGGSNNYEVGGLALGSVTFGSTTVLAAGSKFEQDKNALAQ
jgi:hypothetical protein